MMIALFVLALLAPMIIAWFKKPRYLFWVFVLFYSCFGIMELVSKMQTGISISGHFWSADTTDPMWGWVFIGGWFAMCLVLAIHFKIHKKR